MTITTIMIIMKMMMINMTMKIMKAREMTKVNLMDKDKPIIRMVRFTTTANGRMDSGTARGSCIMPMVARPMKENGRTVSAAAEEHFTLRTVVWPTMVNGRTISVTDMVSFTSTVSWFMKVDFLRERWSMNLGT